MPALSDAFQSADWRIFVLSANPQESGRSSSSERVSAIFGRKRKKQKSRTKDEDDVSRAT